VIRFIGIDIDGTLLDSSGRIPHANRQAIEAALDRGVHVAIVTGRSYHFARPIVGRLGLPVQLIASNGAIVRDLDGATLLRRLLPSADAAHVLAETAAFRSDAAVMFDRPDAGQIVSGGIDWQHPSRVGYYTRNASIIHEAVPLEDCLVEDPIEVMFNGEVTRMRELLALLRARLDPERFTLSVTEYEQRDFTLVDVLAGGVTKGTTMALWAGRLGAPREAVMAIGDNYNDREMLAYAGTGVVMGNAVPELLVSGLPVTASNDDAGLAAAIEKYVLQSVSAAGDRE
jgi:Cof subfamily protein (haloacid dehalogenase superfamily)